MEKNTIKRYAVWARTELISRVAQKAQYYGIEENKPMQYNIENIGDELLTPQQKQQRRALIQRIEEKGYQQVIEEVAYTWFNRFCALRYMEVNNYLPSHVRVFTNEENEFKPQILTEAIHLELDGLDMKEVYAYKEANDNEALYKYLLTVQCNALGSILPGMFRKISGYAELLFPDKLLLEGSVIDRMLEIPEEDWTDQVQIIGWLYQYYNTEPKDKVFANLKKNIKVSKENIPAATQLFTPDWIVRYMVENSLGRLWAEGHGKPKDAEWRYYLEEAEQEAEVQAQLDEIRSAYRNLAPEDIRCIDPCMGSGHILCYMFDVLMQIYNTYGYPAHEAVESIIMNNLYGLELDKRAAQLAYFAVMMKARQYDRRFFSREIQPHTMHFQNLRVNAELLPEGILREMALVFADADELGSLLDVTTLNVDAAAEAIDELTRASDDEFTGDLLNEEIHEKLQKMVTLTRMLQMKYDVVCTNPPYMGSSGMNARLSDFVKKRYPDSKSDLFAVFMEKCGLLAKQNGYYAMITQHAWMFLSSYEKLRAKLMIHTTVNMAHLGARAFDEIGGEVVQTTAFVNTCSHIAEYLGIYARLVDEAGQAVKEAMFLSWKYNHTAKQENFSKIPGRPVAYWVSAKVLYCFLTYEALGKNNKLLAGTSTGDNDQYLRIWHEVKFNDISKNAPTDLSKKWYPCNTGGSFRKYTLNDDYIINWENDGYRIKHHINSKGKIGSAVRNKEYHFKTGITWNKLSSTNFGVRLVPDGYISDDTARMIVCDDKKRLLLLGFLCSKVCRFFLEILSPTMSFTNSELKRLPVELGDQNGQKISTVTNNNIILSMEDRSAFETSWDFKRHPLI